LLNQGDRSTGKKRWAQMSESAGQLLNQAPQVLWIALIACLLAVAALAAVLHRTYCKRLAALREAIEWRDERLSQFQTRLHSCKVHELQAKITGLKPQLRRRITPRQRAQLIERGALAGDEQFTVEIIHDMTASDCSAYANDLKTILDEIGWSVLRSAVLGPGWIARSGLGIHVRDRARFSRAETAIVNALAAAGIDHDLIQIPELRTDVGLFVSPLAVNRLESNFSSAHFAASESILDLRTLQRRDLPPLIGPRDLGQNRRASFNVHDR
jgi:hypothetical protein